MDAIKVDRVSKAYKNYRSHWDRLIEWIDPSHKPRHNISWVLQEVSFNVASGEAVGVVGINGAGKSTLLKIITGTTAPTSGLVSVNGHVAALLELGMGFHPDFTGRENVYMSGQLLGYALEDLVHLMPEVEAFSELGDYMDQPVRVYSSGMQVRLAFSVATLQRPAVLIVDEALSVGDIQFQQKCMERIRSFRKQGTTILLVTHDIGALSTICDRTVVLSKGKVLFDGPVAKGVEAYFTSIAAAKQGEVNIEGFRDPAEYIEEVFFEGSMGNADVLLERETVTIRLRLKNLANYSDPHVGIRIQDRYGLIIYETNSYCQGVDLKEFFNGADCFDVSIQIINNLGVGEYTLAVGVENGGMPGGGFESVILPTQIMRKFRVMRAASEKLIWGGYSNLTAKFIINRPASLEGRKLS